MQKTNNKNRYPGAQLFDKHPLIRDIFIHAILFAASLFLANVLIFDSAVNLGATKTNWIQNYFLKYLPLFVTAKILIYSMMSLLRGSWRYAGIKTLSQILLAGWWFVFSIIVLSYFLQYGVLKLYPESALTPIAKYFAQMPKRLLVLDFISTVFMVASARLGYRIYLQEFRSVSTELAKRILIIGAGDAGESFIREVSRTMPDRYAVVGLIDDNPAKSRMIVHQVSVLGTTDDVPKICEQNKIEEIIIAVPSATKKQLNRIVDICSTTKAEIKTLPSVADIIEGRVSISQIKNVDINDLLGRDVVKLDTQAIKNFLTDRTILVTGAGGSIGSEMCRQIAQFKPKKIILLEQSETPLFDIENELNSSHSKLKLLPVVCDIYDRDRVMQIWQKLRPQVVFHAAAHKHVPLMELNPCEALKNNILGTKNVADASAKFNTDEFVTISTDKAVNPSSVMGCSKRIGEIYTQALNDQPDCNTNFKAVRFGNVLGSNGSVIPTFRRQIAVGGPVTVTDPKMTRYFMTIPEAAQLVLQAASTGTGGQIFLLDMGEPVKIDTLARKMITLSGLKPDEDIDIIYTGARPGEKLFEELKNEDENIVPTIHPKVMIWKHSNKPWNKIEDAINTFKALSNSTDRDQIIKAMTAFVPEYNPLNPPKSTPLSDSPKN